MRVFGIICIPKDTDENSHYYYLIRFYLNYYVGCMYLEVLCRVYNQSW